MSNLTTTLRNHRTKTWGHSGSTDSPVCERYGVQGPGALQAKEQETGKGGSVKEQNVHKMIGTKLKAVDSLDFIVHCSFFFFFFFPLAEVF